MCVCVCVLEGMFNLIFNVVSDEGIINVLVYGGILE